LHRTKNFTVTHKTNLSLIYVRLQHNFGEFRIQETILLEYWRFW